ncbi:MAG TPA: DMT family transporter [Nitrospirota bacterium]
MWLVLSLLAAFTQATADAFTKKAISGTDTYIVAMLRNLLAVPFLVVALIFIPVPKLDGTFYIAVAASLPLEILASLLYVKAIECSPLSLTMPFQALTPLFLLFSSFIMLGEVPSAGGITGVVLICAGAYLLNAHTLRRGGIFAPFRAIFREKGSMMMIGVAFIYALTSDLGKLALLHSSPQFFGAVYVIIFSLVFMPVNLALAKKPLAISLKGLPVLVLVGFCVSVMAMVQPIALSLSNVSYMIAVKRTSLLFSIGYGYMIFREINIRERLIGAAVMLAGLVFIVFSK